MAGGGGDNGHESVTAWLPESERVITLASNTADVIAEDLLAELAPALIAGDPLPVPDEAAPVDPEEAAAAEGTYELDGGDRLEVAAHDDGLAVTALGPDATRALFPPADEADAERRAHHEDQLRALLAGETSTGREEVATLEEDLGPIESVEILGTVDDGELHTYARIKTATGETLAWYALDEAGAISAVEITNTPPTLLVTPTGSATYRPATPTAGAPPVTLTFTPDEFTLTAPTTTVTARRLR